MTKSPQVEFLEAQLKRPLFNIDDYGLIYQNPFFAIRDKTDPLMNFEYRKVYRLNDAGEIVALNLASCELQDVSFLKDLASLQSLDLSDNNISDASFLKDLASLQSLYLSYNNISDASFLKDLASLQSLDLRNNNISDLGFLEDQPKLRTIDVRRNKVLQLSKSLLQLGIEVEEGPSEEWLRKPGSLTWFGNPIESPPVEVLRRGHQAIVDFFGAGEMEALRSAKVLVVGEAEVGKTSLIKQLLNRPFDPKERKTHDIARHQLPMTCGEKG